MYLTTANINVHNVNDIPYFSGQMSIH